MKRRFLFVVDVADDALGGMARHFRFVGREIERRGHDVDYIFLDQMPPPLARRLGGFSLDVGRRAYTAVARYLRTHRPDLIYWGVNCAFPFTTINRLTKTRIPIVGMTFGVEERWWPIADREIGEGKAPAAPSYQRVTQAIRRQALKWATVHCDYVVCASSQDRDYLLSRHGLDSRRVVMIPVGVGPEYFAPPSASRSGTRLLFVGTWIWRKGTRYLVEAMQQVWKTRPDCHVSLVGTLVPVEDVLRSWPPACRERITVTPREDEGDLVRKYATHDIFVLPSLFEGMPMSLVEAMAAQMAVVTTSTCGMQDVIHSGEQGILVPPRDANALAGAIVALLASPQRQRQLGAAAAARITSQTWDLVAAQFLDVFLDAIASQPSRTARAMSAPTGADAEC